MGAWDDRKNINQKQHHLSFETAQLVFEDLFAVTAEDCIDDNGEMRYQTLGLVDDLLILAALRQATRSPAPLVQRVVEDEETPWIISGIVRGFEPLFRSFRWLFREALEYAAVIEA